MSNISSLPWGNSIRIDTTPVQGDLLVGNADGTFTLSSQISGASLAPNSVDTAQIADGAVTTAKIPSGAITTAKLIDQGIITAKLADGAVTAPKMPDGVITTTKISDGAITTGKIQANAITTNLLAAGAVTADTIAAGSITTDKILANAITTLTINAQAITTDKITVGGVQTTNIQNYAVSNTAYVQGTASSAGSAITTPSVSLLSTSRVSILVTYSGGDDLGITPSDSTLYALVNGASFTNNSTTIRAVGHGVGFTTYPISGVTVITSVSQAYASANTTLLTFYSPPSDGNYTFSAYAAGRGQLISLLVTELKR